MSLGDKWRESGWNYVPMHMRASHNLRFRAGNQSKIGSEKKSGRAFHDLHSHASQFSQSEMLRFCLLPFVRYAIRPGGSMNSHVRFLKAAAALLPIVSIV